MLLRRATRIAVLVFLAGPVLNLECFVACATKHVAGSPQACHGTGDPGPTIESARDCGTTAAHLAPFVKSSEMSLTLATPGAEAIESIDPPSQPVPTLGLLDTGPPNRPTVIALRI